jgi:hypothetical protein
MRPCKHPDFEQAILQASDHFQDRSLRPAIIEKDYYGTEALRIVAAWSSEGNGPNSCGIPRCLGRRPSRSPPERSVGAD